jgi:acyl-CoA dehydrogenase
VDADELDQVLKTVRGFVRDRVVPREPEIDAEDRVPDEIRTAAAEMGLFGFAIPEEYGGLGLSMAEEARLVMELGWTTPSLRSMFGTNNGIAGHVLLEGGTEEQKHTWLPRLASGEVVASFALTEPDAGSNPAGLRTRATLTPEGAWEISGAKRFITNAPTADVFMVFARTDPDATGAKGITAFLVPRDTPGLSVAPKDRKMGQFGAHTADVHFDGVRVGPEYVVGGADPVAGAVGRGYSIAMRCLSHGRIHIAALCVGMADRLVEESVAYTRTREQGGRPIAAFQLVQGLVADSVTDLYAGRSLVLEVARAFDAGTDMRVGPATAKYFASEMVGRVADRAVQIHGGAGYMRESTVERFYRDARLFRIYEGTSQIQQVIIAREVIGAAVDGG